MKSACPVSLSLPLKLPYFVYYTYVCKLYVLVCALSFLAGLNIDPMIAIQLAMVWNIVLNIFVFHIFSLDTYYFISYDEYFVLFKNYIQIYLHEHIYIHTNISTFARIDTRKKGIYFTVGLKKENVKIKPEIIRQ